MITGAQVRMARAFLRWTLAELATKAGIGISTVQRIEAVDGTPEVADDLKWRAAARDVALRAIEAALQRAGVTFLPDDGKAGAGIRCKVKKGGR